MSKPKSELSLIINTRYASTLLAKALDSYHKYSDLDNEVIIVADNPSWQTLKLLQERKINYYVVHFCNLDMADNFGASKAHRKYVGFINDDVFFGPHWDTVLMDLMHQREHMIGGLYRLEINHGFPCGYHSGNKEEFDEDLFLRSLEEVKKLPINNGIGAPTCINKKDYFEQFGLTFHISHGHGHERQLESRMVQRYKSMGFISPVSTQAGIFHYGSGGNEDHMPIDSLDHLTDMREGILFCFGCGSKKWQYPYGQPVGEKEKAVWKRGYYLCPDCEANNEPVKDYFLPWNNFTIHGGEIYDL